MTTAEENYLAYRAGLGLAAMDSSETSALSTLGDNNIGSHTDTKFDQAVGTHGVTLTTTSITTNLFQRQGAADETGNGFRLPTEFVDNGGSPELHEFDSDELDTISGRLISRIITSEYPGSYRLGTAAPSGDYDTHITNVFSDTRTDGTTVNYNIYQRQTMTAPTTVRPIAVKRANGRTGSFQGLQEMVDSDGAPHLLLV